MRESDFQTAVTNAIINQQTNKVNTGITENKLAVIVEVGDRNAAYTAEEARELAYSIEMSSAQRDWDADTEPLVAYLRDLADVVDGDKAAEEVHEKWEDQEKHQ